jgi:hypothetical protein
VPEPEEEIVTMIREMRKEMADGFNEVLRHFDLVDKRLEEIGLEYDRRRAAIEKRMRNVK